MESQPQNSEFGINPENFHPWETHLNPYCAHHRNKILMVHIQNETRNVTNT